jgi:hypothetical protein
MKIAQELNEEDQRAISEGLSEEELAVFDILTKPEIPLTDKDKDEVKRIARDLLETLKREKLVLDWRKRQQARASVRVAVLDELEMLPSVYTDEMYQTKSDLVYQHIYDHYYGQGKGIYAEASQIRECPPGAAIKGNASSGIYHVPGEDYYDVTDPEECFATPQDAEAAGYRASEL